MPANSILLSDDLGYTARPTFKDVWRIYKKLDRADARHPAYFREQIANMRAGLARGLYAATVHLAGTREIHRTNWRRANPKTICSTHHFEKRWWSSAVDRTSSNRKPHR